MKIARTTNQIEADIQKTEDIANSIRNEISELSDQCLRSFADWVYNNELQTVKEFVETKAYEEFSENVDI